MLLFSCVGAAEAPTLTRVPHIAAPAQLPFQLPPPTDSVFTASATLAATDVSLDVNLVAAGDAGLVGVRANPNKGLGGENAMPGLWLHFDTAGAWALWTSIAGTTVISSGTLPVVPRAGEWHTIRLVIAAGNTASGFIDGQQAFAGVAVGARVPATGFPGLGVGSWGQHGLFDNFVLKAST